MLGLMLMLTQKKLNKQSKKMSLLKTWREFAITRLTDSEKETGFLPNQSAATKYFPKKPGFWTAMRKSL